MSDKQLTERQCNALKFADYIEKLPDDQWDIKDTDRCFIGHKRGCFGYQILSYDINCLDSSDYDELIMPGRLGGRHNYALNPELYTKEKAVRVLRNLALTGKVDWSL